MDDSISNFPDWGIFQLPNWWWGVFGELSAWSYALIVLGITHVTIAGVTIYLHRGQTHLAVDLHPFVSHVFRAWLFLTTGISTKQWVAVHRKHHANVETKDDPHSPHVFGIWKVLTEGADLYRKSAQDSSVTGQYGHGTPDDWLERRIYTPFSFLWSWVPGSLVLLVLFGAPAIVMVAVIGAWIPFFAAGCVNGIGHFWGYRNFDTPDESRNFSPWGILIGGEELHNNHHRYPSSAKLSDKWWEFDIGWLYIKILSSVGLATIKRVHTSP